VDTEAGLRASQEIVANIIVDWCVYDPFDFSDEPARLPLPATTEAVDLLPTPITTAISEIVGAALNPPQSQGPTTSKR